MQLNPRGDNATAGRNRMGLGGMPDDGQKIPVCIRTRGATAVKAYI